MERPLIAQRSPCGVAVDAGASYWWCSCGRSSRQPFCDGSHKGGAFTPLKVVAEASETLWFCACKQTRTPPFCDGSHRRIDEVAS